MVRDDDAVDPAVAGGNAERPPSDQLPVEATRTCPNCGAALTDRSCKLICPTPGCGYFLSCSDYR